MSSITYAVIITLMAVNPETTVRKIISLPRGLAERVSDYRFQAKLATEAEAFRRLIERGLEAEARAPKHSR